MNTIKTDLDAFNYVVECLLKQNDKSMNNSEDCQYRGFLFSEVDNALSEATIGEDGDFDYDIFLNILYSLDATAKCAVGHLISDEHYDDHIEGKMLDEDIITIVKLSNPNWVMSDKSFDLLKRLQKTHDSLPVERWRKEFDNIRYHFDENGCYYGSELTHH